MANHVVNSLNFEIKVATKSSFEVVSKEISELVNQSLGKLIDEIFSEIYPEQHLLVINKLEIDLGQLRVDQLRGDLTQKFKNQLTIAFKEHLKSLSVQISSSDEIPFLILDGYIRSGVRPQWLQAREASFQQHLARAFKKNPRRFSTKIREYLRNPTYKKRVLENFSEGMLMQSVLVEHPLNSEVLSDEISRLSDFFRQQYRHLAPSSSSMLFKNMLVGILMYPQKINKLSSFRAAVASEMERQFGTYVAASYQESGFAIGYSETSLSRTSKLTAEVKEKLAIDQRTVAEEALIQKFQFFMFHGYTLTDNKSTSYRYRNINTLFLTLLSQNFEDLVEFLLAYGKSAAIKRRFLDSLSQDAILEFFAKVAPQKRKLLEWVVDVFEQVQEDYQPINQTLIQVKKSINEITYDLFLTKNLQSISDENYLRFLFKKTAQKYGISYKNLLFLTLKSIFSKEKKYRVFNFSQTLEDLYATDVLKKKGFTVGDLIFSSKRLEEKEFRDNYKNRIIYISVFSKFYIANYGSLPEGVIAWLRTKVHATPLNSATQLIALWKEFVKKFKLKDETLSFSALLKEKGIEVSGDLFRPSKVSDAQEWKANIKSKEEIISLFSGFYTQQYGALPEAVTNWLGAKVQSISLNGPTPLLKLWKEFVKKYKLKDETLSFSALLKEKGIEVSGDLFRPSKESDAQEWKANFKSKEEIISLFSGFYSQQYGVLPEAVTNWLGAKVQSISLNGPTQLLKLWKEFVKKYKLNDETLSFSTLLKEKGIEISGDLFSTSKASNAQEWKANFKSKEEIISLFSDFYSQSYGALPETVTNWLGAKVQSISLNGPTPLLKLWKEFVEKYKLNDESLSFAALLKEKGIEVRGLIKPSKVSDEVEWKTNFKTKEELISLLSSFYKENNKDLPVAVTDWLGIKVKSISLTNPTQLLELWKEFVKKYKLKDHTLSFSTLLKEKGVEISDLIRTSKKGEEQEWKANFKTKEELISLLSSFYKENHATVPVGVVDWLRVKVQSISLTSSTQMLELWKEFVKKYKLKVDSLSFSALLKENGFKVGDSIRPAKKDDEREWKLNFQNKEELISLFSSLYREQFGSLPTEVSSWLRTRLKDLALNQSSSLFELWEDFAQTYSLPVGDLLIPSLMERNVNPSIKLTVVEFNYWVKKYSIQGIYPSKPTDAVLLLSYLLTHKKVVSIDVAKKIAAGLLISLASSKAAFIKVAELIRPRLATSIPGFIVWIEQLLKENNAEALEGRVYIWLYHQFILSPSNQLTVASLQDKVSHFLQLNKDGASWTDANGFIATSMRMSSQKRRQRSLSSKMIARIFSILGTREVYAIFSEAKRYDEEILLKLLINKYSKSFYQLLDTHRFNSEFQDAILVQAPKWLKKQIIDYLLQRSTFDWNSSLSAIKSYFEENKWIKLDGASFESLIEITLWRQIFDPNPVGLEELILELLNKAMDSRLLTPKFWKDLKVYVQIGRQAKEDNSIVSLSKLEGLDGFEILVSRTGFQKEEASILPILEGLVYDAVFPVGHTFEGSPAEEYGEYISKLVLENRNEFLNLFSKVKSPILSRRFINLLEYRGLLLLIKEKHKRDSLVISVTQLERIVKAFGVREQGKVEIFLRAWLVYLFHSGTTQLPAAKLVGAVAALLLEEGILDKVNLDLSKSFDSLASLFKWTEAEKKYFFELGQNWADESLISPLSSELAGEDSLVAYLRQGQDPFLKQMKGSGFFTIWLNLFFEIASSASIKSFVALFKNSFYENSYYANKKYELFFQRFFQLKEGYDSFRQALVSDPKLWLEFRKNNPNLFKEIELGVEAKKKPMTLLELLQFYISYGALPKEEGSLQAFAKRLIGIKGADVDKVRKLFLTSLVATNKKKNLLKLLRYVDEKWFFELLHPKLYVELDHLVEEVRRRTGSNLYADLRILDKVDRILFFAEAFSKYGLPSKHVIEFILPIFEQWMETKTASVIAAIFIGSEPKSELLVLIQHTSRKVKKIIEEELEKNEQEVEEEPVVPEPEELDFGIGVSVYNAGMVLCWPFFGRFFAALGLVEQGKFKGQQAEERAVQLLQYLATGLTEFEEWDLSLNKVLCGVPMNTPIAPSFVITLEEEEMVNKLINGTIFNWEKMRGTRLETFRETFFMRTGMLYEKDNRWELIVERKAYDLLLDTLTWNITMINLSMMKKRLNVQWK